MNPSHASRLATILSILVTAAALAAPAEQGAPADAPSMEDLMKAMGQVVMQGSTNPAATVDFRELKALLPAELTGLKRKSASGEKTGMMGMTVAYAEGSYASEDGATVDIKITDMGGMGAMGGLARGGWGTMEIDRESDTGYERTTTIKGHKAYEKYDSETKSGQVEVMVGEHFMVEIQGYGVTSDGMKEAINKIDLEKLAELEPVAAPSPTPAPTPAPAPEPAPATK